jgi:hypothetical protein
MKPPAADERHDGCTQDLYHPSSIRPHAAFGLLTGEAYTAAVGHPNASDRIGSSYRRFQGAAVLLAVYQSHMNM